MLIVIAMKNGGIEVDRNYEYINNMHQCFIG